MCVRVVVFKEYVKYLYFKGQLDSTDSEDEDTSWSVYFDDSLSLLECRGCHYHWSPAWNCWWIIWSLCFSGSYKYRFCRSLPQFFLTLLLFSLTFPQNYALSELDRDPALWWMGLWMCIQEPAGLLLCCEATVWAGGSHLHTFSWLMGRIVSPEQPNRGSYR